MEATGRTHDPNPRKVKAKPSPAAARTELLRSDIEALFEEMDEAMAGAGITGSIELVGGAAMALRFYDRIGTTDVDGAMHPSREILAVADQIAAANGLRPGWLNSDAQGFIPPGDTGEEPTIVKEGVSLTVKVAGPMTLLAMKLRASRPVKDADDIAVLLRECGVATLDEARAVLDELYGGEHELSERGERIVLGALGSHRINLADGTVWQLDPVVASPPSTCGKWILRQDRRCALPPEHAGVCA